MDVRLGTAVGECRVQTLSLGVGHGWLWLWVRFQLHARAMRVVPCRVSSSGPMVRFGQRVPVDSPGGRGPLTAASRSCLHWPAARFTFRVVQGACRRAPCVQQRLQRREVSRRGSRWPRVGVVASTIARSGCEQLASATARSGVVPGRR
jgi:hypothetical protein